MDEQSDDASESDPEMDAFLDAELRPAELHQKPEASRWASAHASPVRRRLCSAASFWLNPPFRAPILMNFC